MPVDDLLVFQSRNGFAVVRLVFSASMFMVTFFSVINSIEKPVLFDYLLLLTYS